MNKEQEKFLAGLFATWIAQKRGHNAPDQKDKRQAQSAAESARYAYNALVRT
jgi:hypothetical protein